MAVKERVASSAQMIKYFGPGWVMSRVAHTVRRRSGWLAWRAPVSSWDDHPLSSFLSAAAKAEGEKPKNFFFSGEQRQVFRNHFSRWDGGSPDTGEADAVLKGNFRLFGDRGWDLGALPRWHVNPLSGQALPSNRHWSRLGDFDFGDIKGVWELSRFSFVYGLVRAYWRTGGERYPEFFWRLVEDWRVQNPPHQGPHWKCGQEASLRVMAWCFGLQGFRDAPSSTPARIDRLRQMIGFSGERIAFHMSYALSQNNNHGVSEGLGLFTIGALFPEFRKAAAWERRGRLALEDHAARLIDEDGAFAQHSVNYHRMMLQEYTWASRLADLRGRPFSPALKDKLRKSVDFFFQMLDEASGDAPCYGHNDGSWVLPLNRLPYRDHRPALQAASYAFAGVRCFPEGPWDEDLLWLFGPEALHAPVRRSTLRDLSAPAGGYYTLRAEDGFAFTRCGPYKHRPAQADALHADIWWRGLNIALDPGTFSYNPSPAFMDGLADTACHNTVTVDGMGQMKRQGRFMWLPWSGGEKQKNLRGGDGQLAYWQGLASYGHLADPVSHARGILSLGPAHWVVVDRLTGAQNHAYRLHWLLADTDYTWDESRGIVCLATPQGLYQVQSQTKGARGEYSLVRADEKTCRGWRAPFYLRREAALSLAGTVKAPQAIFWTVLGPGKWRVSEQANNIHLQGDDFSAKMTLSAMDESPLIERVEYYKSEKKFSLAVA